MALLWPKQNTRMLALYLDILVRDPIRFVFGRDSIRGDVFSSLVIAFGEAMCVAVVWVMVSLAAWTYPYYTGVFFGLWEVLAVVVLGYALCAMEVCRAEWRDIKRLESCHREARRWK